MALIKPSSGDMLTSDWILSCLSGTLAFQDLTLGAVQPFLQLHSTLASHCRNPQPPASYPCYNTVILIIQVPLSASPQELPCAECSLTAQMRCSLLSAPEEQEA